MDTVKQSLDALLSRSRATAEFKQAVRALEQGEAPGGRIAFNAASPPVKVLRTIAKLLEERPDLAIERVAIEATSGCSDFTGTLRVEPGALNYAFVWDCKWRAEQQGWTDPLGFPDQIRAAREYGYQCFQRFEPKS